MGGAQESDTDGVAPSIADRIDLLVGPHAETKLFSGVIHVVQRREVLFRRGYGYANWELGVPITTENRLGIASITKVMTQIVVDKLVNDRALDLEAPVATYLPGFPSGPDGGIPTIRHLLDHEAGVPHRVTDEVEETQALRPEDVVAKVREAGLMFEPGSSSLYSSAGYTCLARIVELVEGKSFDEVLKERVFEPAEMNSATDETRQKLMPGRALPYRLGVSRGEIAVTPASYKHLGFLTGAGSVYATAMDLVRFVDSVQSGVFGVDIASTLFDGDSTEWQGLYGRTNGYDASVEILLAEGLVLVVLTNLQSASTWQLRQEIKDLLSGKPAEAVPLPPTPSEPFEDPTTLVGTYGPAEITLVDGHLFRGDNEFYPVDGERYYIPGSGSLIRFRRDSTGAVDALVSFGFGSERVLPKIDG